jgi:hypothetical protein
MNRRGQNISEYGIVLALVMLALYSMNAYFKRSVQGVVEKYYGPGGAGHRDWDDTF